MKKLAFIAFALFAVPMFASADIQVLSLTLNGDPETTVAPGGDVDFEFIVDRQPNNPGSDNDFRSFKVDILPDGLPQGACVNVNHTIGAGTSTESYTLAASSTEGLYDAVVYIYRNSNCSNLRDTFTVADGVEVKIPVVVIPPPPSPVEEKSGGGGFICRGVRVLETDPETGHDYWACRSQAPALGGSTIPVCQMLQALSSNSVSYCPLSPQEEIYWSNPILVAALTQLYNLYGR